MRRISRIAALLLLARTAGAQYPAGNAPPAPSQGQAGALIDLTGYWVTMINEDWRWRMVTPPKGDYASVPLNAAGKKQADTWDRAKDEAAGEQCRAYGAAGIMRLPIRLHITWADANTLKVETDAGGQIRLFHFDGAKWQGGEPTLQGDSAAVWQKQTQFRGFGGRSNGPSPGKGGDLKVVTSHLKAGYLRSNGVPYSDQAVLTEFFDRVEPDGASGTAYLILTSIVNDPVYLNDTFITSEQFKREADGSKWDPAPCSSK